MLLAIDRVEPEHWLLARVVDVLRKGGVVVFPTDTVYALGCDIYAEAAIQRVYRIKKIDPKKPLSIIVSDQAMAGRYVRSLPNNVFRLMKRVLPGPYTFILEASNEVPKIMLRKRRTIGVRIPDDPVTLALVKSLGNPLLTTSIRQPDDAILNDPMEIEARYARDIDLVVDGGPLLPEPSTVVDFTLPEPEVVRVGRGDPDVLWME